MGRLIDFYKNKKVLITGHTGFKGSWMTEILLIFSANILGFSIRDKKKKIYEKTVNFKKVKNVYSNILNFKKLKKTITAFKPQIVFHFAAQSLVIDGYKDSFNTFQTNCAGLINLLKIVDECKSVKSFIVVTSDKCYKIKKFKKNYKEKDELGGIDPYSASKAASEIICLPYFYSFKKKNIGFATVRAGNVVGGGDFSTNRVIPDCYKASISKKLIVRNPNFIRPWQHVLDVLNGYLILAMKLCNDPNKYSGSWNFGPSEKKKKRVIDIVNEYNNNLKKKFKIKIINYKKYKESETLSLNTKKAKKKLNWSQKISFINMIKMTVNLYNNYNKKNYNEVLRKQIKFFFKI